MTAESVCGNKTVYFTDDLDAVVLFQDYPDGLLKLAIACCVIFMFIGIPGNLITIIALAKYKKIRNATLMFVINLSLTDLLFCSLILPISAGTYSHRSWFYGNTLCRLFSLAKCALIAVSLLTICAITINRYIMIAHPITYPKLYTSRNIGLIIASIWIVSFGSLIVTWFDKWGRFGLDSNIGLCTIIPDCNNRSPMETRWAFTFIFTCAVIIVCYTRIFFIVRKATKASLKTDKKVPKDDESTDPSTAAPVKLNREASNIAMSYQESSIVTSNPGLQRTVTIKVDRDCKKSRLTRKLTKKTMATLRISLPTRKDMRLGTMIIAIMCSFFLSSLPITITTVFAKIYKTSPAVNTSTYILLFLSSCLNPIVYVVMSNEYRKAYKNLLKSRRRRVTNQA